MLQRLAATVRALLRYGRPDDGDGGQWWGHWQNESAASGEGDLPIRGRAWLHFDESGNASLSFEWNAWSSFAFVGVSFDESEGDITVKAALPPLAVWVHLTSGRLFRAFMSGLGERDISVSFHDHSLFWKLWADPNGWTSSTPRWRDGSINVANVLFGEADYQSQPLGAPVFVDVPMPEGTYPGTCQMDRSTWTRKRWPRPTVKHCAIIKMETPIPVPGKGENAWDCDDDALHESSCLARTPGEAVASVVASVLRTREKRGGLGWRPPAQAATAAVEDDAPEASAAP